MKRRVVWIGLALGACALAAATTAGLSAAPRAWMLAAGGGTEAGERLGGTWTIGPGNWKHEGGPAVQLTLRTSGGNWDSSSPVSVADLHGLTTAQMQADGADVRFEIARDAGTVSLEGRFKKGEGAGHFTFTPDPGYLTALRGMGYRDVEPEAVFSLALHDVSRAFIGELRDLGYAGVSLDSLVSFRIHGVSAQMVRELKALGYDKPDADGLVSLRIHGATPEFVRSLKDLGYDPPPSLDELVSMRIHGASPEMVRALRELGYEHVAVDELVSMRIHGASPEFVRELKALGYERVPVEDLVSMRIHGVSPEFIRKANERSGHRVPVERLVSMRIHGKDTDEED